MDDYLFIGGDFDGRKIAVNQPVVEFTKPREFDAFEANNKPSIEHQRYRRIRIASGDRVSAVYLEESISESDLFELMVANYRPEAKKIERTRIPLSKTRIE